MITTTSFNRFVNIHPSGLEMVSRRDTKSDTISGNIVTETPFGKWLKFKRKASDMTQQQLAERVGCTAIAIRKMEAEERRPSQQIAELLAQIFDIPISERNSFIQYARGSWDFAPAGINENAPWRIPEVNSNVPHPLTSFIGREKLVEDVTGLLKINRLVTLTGPGGVGKTRLAVQASHHLVNDFEDGVYWVELAPVTDKSLILQAVAASLGLHEITNQPLKNIVFNFLGSRHLLLVLDNCEHLVAECAHVVDWLLGSCPNLKILTTSREVLDLTGELNFVVPVLSLPNVQQMSLIDLLMQYESIRLFVERTSVIRPGFALTERNAFHVTQICQRLDGMPLAIELAAARVAMMSIEEIAKHLDDRFNLLTSGNRAVLPRHQTLRAAIDWSYELLSDSERIFFNRLSVFGGGFTLESARQIAAGGNVSKTQVIDLLGHLINKSLVIVISHADDRETETRYAMLETIHEYAREKLSESGEMKQVQQHHYDYFSVLAEQSESKLKGPQQLAWLDRLDVEHDNIRLALHWLKEIGNMDALLHLSMAMFWFWSRRHYLSEGRAWLEHGVSALDGQPIILIQVHAFYGIAYLARIQGDFINAREFIDKCMAGYKELDLLKEPGYFLAHVLMGTLMRDDGHPIEAQAMIEEAVLFFRKSEDQWNLASALLVLGLTIRDQEEYELAWSTVQESVTLWRGLEEVWGLAESLHALTLITYRRGDYEMAFNLMEETLAIRRRLGDKYGIAYSIHNLGVFALAQEDVDRARTYFDQDLILYQEVGDRSGVVLALQYQGLIAHIDGDNTKAKSFLTQGLKLARETGPVWVNSNYFLWMAGVETDEGRLERAVRLCGAAKAKLVASASYWDAYETSRYDHIISITRSSLQGDVFNKMFEEGSALTLEQAVIFALEDVRD